HRRFRKNNRTKLRLATYYETALAESFFCLPSLCPSNTSARHPKTPAPSCGLRLSTHFCGNRLRQQCNGAHLCYTEVSRTKFFWKLNLRGMSRVSATSFIESITNASDSCASNPW